MPLSLNDIACMIATDQTPQPDGACNQDRTNYVCDVMGTDYICLDEDIDYALALDAEDPSVVQAAIHLAKLQTQYLWAAFYAEYIDKETITLKAAWFDLTIRKMMWHLEHLKKDVPTPPFTFIH